jgi:gluconolactonase
MRTIPSSLIPTLALLEALALPVAAAPESAPAPVAAPALKTHAVPYPTFGSIERLDPALDKLLPANASLENLAEGFDWVEGPVWVKQGGYLLFSDIPRNVIYRWAEGKGVSPFMKPSGGPGGDPDLKEPGSNGLAIDARGGLLLCQHAGRRIARLPSLATPDAKQVPLAEKYRGKRLNSPNDLVIHSSGAIFFTDPPYGLVKNRDAPGPDINPPEKELAFQGVYRADGKGNVVLLHDGLERPNGIGLSPDQKILYVANSHGPRPIWMAFDLRPDLGVASGRVFFDAAPLIARTKRKGAPDGLKVDRQGNLFATGPGGVLVFSPQGKHLGTILTGQATANCAFGDDGSTLYITADMILARIRTSTKGIGF